MNMLISKSNLFYAFWHFHLAFLFLVQIPLLLEKFLIWRGGAIEDQEDASSFLAYFSKGWIDLTQDPFMKSVPLWYLSTLIMGLFVQLPIIVYLLVNGPLQESELIQDLDEEEETVASDDWSLLQSILLICYCVHLITATFPVIFELIVYYRKEIPDMAIVFLVYCFQFLMPCLLMSLEIKNLLSMLSGTKKDSSDLLLVKETPVSKKRTVPPISPEESGVEITPPSLKMKNL